MSQKKLPMSSLQLGSEELEAMLLVKVPAPELLVVLVVGVTQWQR